MAQGKQSRRRKRRRAYGVPREEGISVSEPPPAQESSPQDRQDQQGQGGDVASASDASRYERPSVTVDAVILTVREGRLEVLLVKRGHWPDEGKWALPGGFVNPNEPLDVAAARELQEETGLRDVPLHQLRAFGDPGRDPRGWTISVAHMALVSDEQVRAQRIAGADDAADAAWFPAYEPPPLAFDHAHILDCALDAVRTRLDCMPLARLLLPEPFTMGQLRAVHEALLHRPIRMTIFRTKMLASGILETAPHVGQTVGRGGQALYRFKPQA